MASSLIGSLRVSLGLDTAQFEAGANKASRIARQQAGAMESSFKSARTAAEGLFAAFTVGFLAEQIKKSLDYAGSIAEVSRTLGVTTKDLQTFRYAATQTGVAQDQLEVGLRRLTVSMGKAELGSTAQAKAFAAIGISVDQLRGKTTGDIFRLMADGLSKVTDRSQRAAIEMALMGRSGSTLDNLLAPGVGRLNDLANAAQQLGIVLSDRQIQGAEETAHKLEAVKMILEANIAGVVAENANSILSLSSALATLTGQVIKFLSSNPQLALSIIGGLAGARFGGLPGAGVGAVAGFAIGDKVAHNAADSNMDPAFRRQQFVQAHAAWERLATSSPSSLLSIHRGSGVGGDVSALTAESHRQEQLFRQALSSRGASKVQGPVTNAPAFLASGGGGSRSGGRRKASAGGGSAASAPEDRTEQEEFQFAQQERQADLQILQAKQQLAGNADQRLALAVQQINLEKDAQDAEIDHKVAQAQRDLADKKINQSTYDQIVQDEAILKGKVDQKAQIDLQALAEEQLTRHEQALVDASDQQLKWQQDALHAADDLATTQADHRRIQLAILDEEIEQRRLELEHSKQLAIRNGATTDEIANIQAQIDHLPTERAQGAAGIINNTKSPFEQWAAQVPHDAATINEALQTIETQGLDNLSDALAKVIDGTGSLKSAFHDLAASVLEDLLKMTIKMLLFRAISAIGGAFGGSAGGDFGSAASGVGSTASGAGSALSGLGGFATGGGFDILGHSGTDRNILSLNGLPIARVSHGERLSIGNDNMPMGGQQPVSLTMHNDFSGVDPASVARVEAKLNQMQTEFPARVVATMADAKSRFMWRG